MSTKVDLTPDIVDLVFYAGDVGDFQVIFTNSSDEPIDLSYLTWAAQIRKTRTSVDYTVLVIDTTDASIGVLIVKIPGDITRLLADDLWNKTSQWDLQATSGGIDSATILQGSIYSGLDVTR